MITESALLEAETIEVINNILEFQWQKKIKPEWAEELIESVGTQES